MAKDTRQFLKELKAKIEGLTREYVKSPAIKDLARAMVEQVRKRTRLGKGVDDKGNQTNLLNLQSKKYKAFRKKHRNRLSSFTTPTKSNLTATGQLLDNIQSEITDDSILLYFKEKREVGLDGRISKSEKYGVLTNPKLATYVQKQGRQFFGLTNSEEKKFVRQVREDIIKLLKKK